MRQVNRDRQINFFLWVDYLFDVLNINTQCNESSMAMELLELVITYDGQNLTWVVQLEVDKSKVKYK